MQRQQQAPNLPSVEQYAKILAAHENEDLSEKKTPGTSSLPAPPFRVPVNRTLMKVSKKSTNPVGRKRAGKGGGWRNITAGDAVGYGLKAWQLAKHLATLINVEEKVFDVDGSGGTTITSTPSVVNLSNIGQGTDYYQRVGDSILAQTIEFRGVVSGNSATAANRIRILIVRDKLQRGADPVMGDVLQGGTDPTVQPYLEPQDQRFDVLYDETICITNLVGLATSGTSTNYGVVQHELPSFKRKFNQHIKYQSTAAADASNWVGGLFLMAVSLDATNGPNLRYTFRLRFTDN